MAKSNKYHINQKTGRPNQCHALSPEACPYFDKDNNTPAPHFDTKIEARKYVEETMEKEYGKNSNSIKKKEGLEEFDNPVFKKSFNYHYTGFEKVYEHAENGKVIYVNDVDEVLAYDKNGHLIKTTLSVEKLEKGFGKWEEKKLLPPESMKNMSKAELYKKEQDKLLNNIKSFVQNKNDSAFQPQGKIQKKYWDAIKNGDIEGKTPAVKNTMINSAIAILGKTGFDVEKFNNEENNDKYQEQKIQKKILHDIKKQGLSNDLLNKLYGLDTNNTTSYKNKKSTYEPTADPNTFSGVKYDKDNMNKKIVEYLNKNREKVKESKKIKGLTITEYRQVEGAKDNYVSLVDLKGNIKDIDFTKDPELYKKLGFKGYDAFGSKERDVKQSNISDLSVEKLKPKERTDLAWYTSGAYHHFNRVIFKREGVSKKKDYYSTSNYDKYKSKMGNLDSALSKAPKINKVVYRSMRGSASIFSTVKGNNLGERIDNYVDQNYQVGKTVNFKGYQSTTTRGSFAKSWGQNGVLFEIMTPEGMPIREVSHHTGEDEVLLPRDSNYVIAGVQKSKYGGPSVVQMIAVNKNGDILDGTNADQKNTWEELYAQPLIDKKS